MKKILTLLTLVSTLSIGFGQILISESFQNIATLEGYGWTMTNQSTVPGGIDWFQGNTAVFQGYQGGYIAANYNNTSGNNTISNWLITPVIEVKDGDVVSFYTRTINNPTSYPDRLELRLSEGPSFTTPDGPEDLGSFTTLLLSVNPDLSSTGYPNVWTRFEAAISGVGSVAVPVFAAFRYYVTNAGPNGTFSDYIGIDEFKIEGLSYCGVNSFPFTETFENNSSTRVCWTNEYVSGEIPWTYGNNTFGPVTSSYQGALSARFYHESNTAYTTKLVSPPFDLSGFETAELKFFYANPDWGGDLNSLKVYYKTSADGEWIELAAFDDDITAWTEVSLDLPNPGADYQIAFEGINGFGFGTLVDAVTIDGVEIPASVADTNGNSFSVYPNPTTGLITIKSDSPVLFAEILNPNGQKIKEFDNANIDITSVSAGLYILKVTFANGDIVTQKVIKK